MSHLRLVPPLATETAPTTPAIPAQRTAPEPHPAPWEDPKVALLFFEAASGLCLCRGCAMRRHPSYGATN